MIDPFIHTRKAFSSVDTLRSYKQTNPSPRTLELLDRHCGDCEPRERSRGVTLVLQQPDYSALKILDRDFRKNRDYINRVDIALDLPFATLAEAQMASIFFRQHFVLLGNREYPVACENSIYFKRRRWQSSNVAGYGDKVSKITGEYCLHIEVRAMGSKQAKKIGITRPQSLLDFDIQDFWRQRWVFEAFNEADLLRAATCLARRSKYSDSKRNEILRRIKRIYVCDDNGTPSAAAFRVFCVQKKLHPERYLERIRISLPRKILWPYAHKSPDGNNSFTPTPTKYTPALKKQHVHQRSNLRVHSLRKHITGIQDQESGGGD